MKEAPGDDRNDERLKLKETKGRKKEREREKGTRERRQKRIGGGGGGGGGGLVECLYTAHIYEILSRHADLKCLLRS